MTDREVQVMCRHCDALLSDVVAGSHLRWSVCRSCDLDPHWWLGLFRWLHRRWQIRREARALSEKPTEASHD